MEKNQKVFRYLGECAEIAEKLEKENLFTNTTVTLNTNPKNYLEIIQEIEEFVKSPVNRNQSTISLTIGKTEFIFNRD